MDAQDQGFGRFAFGLLFGFAVSVGTLYIGAHVAQLDGVEFGMMVRAALACTGVNVAFRLLAATMGPGGQAILGLLGLGGTVWALKAVLAVSWGSAGIVAVVAGVLTGVATLALLGLAAAAGNSLGSRQPVSWQ